MIIKANVHEAIKSLAASKQRSILALLGIIIGISSVIGLVSIGAIVRAEAVRQFKDLGVDLLMIDAFGGSDPRKKLHLHDVLAIPEGTASIADVAPYATVNEVMVARGNRVSVTILGATEAFQRVNKLRLAEGRFVSDLDGESFFCVLGNELVPELRKSGYRDILGEQVKLGARIYTVIGILERTLDNNMRPRGINKGVIIPIRTALKSFTKGQIDQVMARMVEGSDYGAVEQEVLDYFARRAPGLKIQVLTTEGLIQEMEKQMAMFTLLLGAIASISLLVGGVGVMNVMLANISERKKEIGIRRALGARRGDIQGQFIIEAMILSGVGGVLGLVVGIGISYLYAVSTDVAFMISVPVIPLGVGVSCAVGVFFGFYPARRAAMMDPIEALRAA